MFLGCYIKNQLVKCKKLILVFILIIRANAGVKSKNHVNDYSAAKTIPVNSHHQLLGQPTLLATG